MEMLYEAASDCFSKEHQISHCRQGGLSFFLSAVVTHYVGLFYKVALRPSSSSAGVAQGASLWWECIKGLLSAFRSFAAFSP